jgi:hypothetical protein
MRELHDGRRHLRNLDACTIRGNVVRDVVQVGSGFGASAYYHRREGAKDCLIEKNRSRSACPCHPQPHHPQHHRARTTSSSRRRMTVYFQRSVGCTFENNTLFVPGKLSVRRRTASSPGRAT